MLSWLRDKLGLDDMELKLKRLESGINSLGNEQKPETEPDDLALDELESKVEQLESVTSSLTKTVDDVVQSKLALKISQLKDVVSSVAQTVKGMEQTVNALQSASQDLRTEMNSSISSLEQTIKKVERDLYAGMDSAIEAHLGNSIILVSPDGTQTVTMKADNDCSGIWIAGESGQPVVALYRMKDAQQAV